MSEIQTQTNVADELIGADKRDCPVCLQDCIHPVELPCGHIFCFLCIKGVALQSRRCALCRCVIPTDFLNNPKLLDFREQSSDTSDSYIWFYEGNNGWWQYDERTNTEIEERHKKDEKVFDLLIAGFVYVIDLDNMKQYRRDYPSRQRCIKRDVISAPKKGIAGLRIGGVVPREGAEGQEVDRGQLTVQPVNSGQQGGGRSSAGHLRPVWSHSGQPSLTPDSDQLDAGANSDQQEDLRPTCDQPVARSRQETPGRPHSGEQIRGRPRSSLQAVGRPHSGQVAPRLRSVAGDSLLQMDDSSAGRRSAVVVSNSDNGSVVELESQVASLQINDFASSCE